jgi:hypothetical protein
LFDYGNLSIDFGFAELRFASVLRLPRLRQLAESEEPTIPRKSGEELDEVKINLLPLGIGVNKLIFKRS